MKRDKRITEGDILLGQNEKHIDKRLCDLLIWNNLIEKEIL